VITQVLNTICSTWYSFECNNLCHNDMSNYWMYQIRYELD